MNFGVGGKGSFWTTFCGANRDVKCKQKNNGRLSIGVKCKQKNNGRLSRCEI